VKPDTTPAPTVVPAADHGTVLDSITSQVLGSNILLIATLALMVATIVYTALRIRKIAKSEKPDEPMSNLGMLIGLGWSSEAVWVLTGEGGADLVLPLRILMFAIVELILGVFMIRAKRNMKENGNPGRSGVYARVVASGMSMIAVGTAHNFSEGVFRLLIPVLLILMWWDGLVGEKKLDGGDEGGTFNWTPRKILIRMGAITPGNKDVKTVHREQLIQRMTDLYYAALYGPEKKRGKVKEKLAKLTLDADDDMIQTVMAKVRRTGWVESQPLDYAPAHPLTDELAQEIADLVSQQVAHRLAQSQPEVAQHDAQGFAQHDAQVALPAARRAKPSTQAATSGYATGGDPGTQAAQYAITQAVSNREAAQKFGISEATVRNRRKTIEGASAQDDAAQTKTNGHPVMASTDN
jgi:hypothetical protein